METALSIEQGLRREWGEAAVIHPEAFEQALVVEVRKVGSDGRPQRAVSVSGTFGPHVSERDYFPIMCCDPKYRESDGGLRRDTHQPECRYQSFSPALLEASGGVVSYPPGAEA